MDREIQKNLKKKNFTFKKIDLRDKKKIEAVLNKNSNILILAGLLESVLKYVII